MEGRNKVVVAVATTMERKATTAAGQGQQRWQLLSLFNNMIGLLFVFHRDQILACSLRVTNSMAITSLQAQCASSFLRDGKLFKVSNGGSTSNN
jgi:hypothetical protein